MAKRTYSASDSRWILAVTSLCFRGYVPCLPVASVWNGLNLPDVELDAFCESICANLGHGGGGNDDGWTWYVALDCILPEEQPVSRRSALPVYRML